VLRLHPRVGDTLRTRLEQLTSSFTVVEDKPQSETKLVIDKVGDRYFLRQIWTSVHGQGLQLPESKLEKEVQASNRDSRGSGAETVIVAMR
jgi:hypothetical protein